MLCEKYNRLLPIERVMLIGELVHAMQSDNQFFEMSLKIIKTAKRKGLFDNVKILPGLDEDC